MRDVTVGSGEPAGPLPEHPFFIYADAEERSVALVSAALRKLNAEDCLIRCAEGEALIQCLRDCVISRSLPGFVLLNGHSASTDGFQLLKWIRALPELKSLPVVILSSAPNPEEVDFSVLFGATSYMVEPDSYEGFCSMLGDLLTRFSVCRG